MFGAATGVFLALLLIASLLSRLTPLFILTLALFLAAALARLWNRYCLTGLEYRRHFSRTRVEFGDTVDLDIEIVNRKLLPLAWVEIDDEFPRQLAPERTDVARSFKPERVIVHRLVALRPFERVRRRYRLHCNFRGEYEFGPVLIRTGDLFGLVAREIVSKGSTGSWSSRVWFPLARSAYRPTNRSET